MFYVFLPTVAGLIIYIIYINQKARNMKRSLEFYKMIYGQNKAVLTADLTTLINDYNKVIKDISFDKAGKADCLNCLKMISEPITKVS